MEYLMITLLKISWRMWQ